jgi:predicted transcriptional regulator
MSTVTIGVTSLGDTQRRVSAAFRGKKQGARISFASEDLLWKTLTPKRWALLKLMAGKGPMAIRELARRGTTRRPRGSQRCACSTSSRRIGEG